MIYVTYAGAGGGKTTNMVAKIRAILKELHPNRFVCVITYTNEAATDIRKKLDHFQKIPSNVFIGTIHSFLLRFVIKPHLSNGAELNVVSQISKTDAGLDSFKKWAEKEIQDPIKRKIVIANKESKRKSLIYESLLSKNLITNDQIIQCAKTLIANDLVKRAVARKIQFLFVDEYQDTHKWQHDIFESIHKGKRTDWHVIGDPNQSIYNFVYGTSENGARKPKSYDDFPICKLRKACKPQNYNVLEVNYRSSQEIVDLANLYNQDFQQTSEIGSFTPVIAFATHDCSAIYELFHKHRKQLELINSVFFIAKENGNLEKFKEKMLHTDRPIRCVRSVESSILQITGMNKRQFCESNKISFFQLRTLAILCQSHRELNLELIKLKFNDKFGCELHFVMQDVELPKIIEMSPHEIERTLTIHKSKGLEAESVLVIFETNKSLKKVLTEKILMKSEKTDDLRLAYVAFTRAKKLLAICCLEPLTEDNKEFLLKNSIDLI